MKFNTSTIFCTILFIIIAFHDALRFKNICIYFASNVVKCRRKWFRWQFSWMIDISIYSGILFRCLVFYFILSIIFLVNVTKEIWLGQIYFEKTKSLYEYISKLTLELSDDIFKQSILEYFPTLICSNINVNYTLKFINEWCTYI